MSDESEIKIIQLSVEPRKMEMTAVIPNISVLVAECAELLEAHEAKNYVQFDMIPRFESKVQGYRVTVQRIDGKSPAQRVTEMERRITELEAQLAAASGWEQVEDGPLGSFVSVENDGMTIGVFAGDDYTDWYATADLPDDIRLCRRTPPQTAAGE